MTKKELIRILFSMSKLEMLDSTRSKLTKAVKALRHDIKVYSAISRIKNLLLEMGFMPSRHNAHILMYKMNSKPHSLWKSMALNLKSKVGTYIEVVDGHIETKKFYYPDFFLIIETTGITRGENSYGER